MGANLIGAELFKQRLIAFYSSWLEQKQELWGDSEVLVIHTPPSQSPPHPLSSYFYLWLLGHEFADTTAVFTKKAIFVICPGTIFSSLRDLGPYATEVTHLAVNLHRKDRSNDGSSLVDDVIRNSRRADVIAPVVVGCIAGECLKSKLFNCDDSLIPIKYRRVNVRRGFEKLFNRPENEQGLDSIFDRGMNEDSFKSRSMGIEKGLQKLSLTNDSKEGMADKKIGVFPKEGDGDESKLLEEKVKWNMLFNEFEENKEFHERINWGFPCEFEEEKNNNLPCESERNKLFLKGEKGNPSNSSTDHSNSSEKCTSADVRSDLSKTTAISDPEEEDWVFVEVDEKGAEMEGASSITSKRWHINQLKQSLVSSLSYHKKHGSTGTDD